MKSKSNMITRAISGAIFVIVLVSSVLFGPLPMSFLFAAIAITGLMEYYKIIKKLHITPNVPLGISIGLILYYYFFHHNIFSAEIILVAPLCFVVFLLVSFVFIKELFRKKDNPFLNIGMTLFGVLYAVIPFCLLLEIAHFRNSYEPKIILSIFFLIWANDTFAYITGSFFGKRKLLERVSPGKTWEGFIGGGFFTLVLAFFLNDIMPLNFFWHMTRLDWIIIGLIVFIFGTMGDLSESLLKRSAGIKDSGNIIAGHGGILDRFDSFIFVVPLVYAYLFYIKVNLPFLMTFIN
ncbi:MAG: phosphatidate cytidylyltransferase [Bacteroidota bacterium]